MSGNVPLPCYNRFTTVMWKDALVYSSIQANGSHELDLRTSSIGLVLGCCAIERPSRMCFQHDCAPPHFWIHVRKHLYLRLAQRGTRRGGTIAGLPRSPLSSSEYSCRERLKRIYPNLNGRLNELRRRWWSPPRNAVVVY